MSWDIPVLQFFNQIAGKYHFFDLLVVKFLSLNTVKMLPVAACMVWIWFDEKSQDQRRWQLGQALGGGFVALVVSRIVQNLMPHHPRPVFSPDLDFVAPFGSTNDILHDWSSFPSDNAALAFALAAGVWRASKPLGTFCLFWAIFVISLPRVYAGYHYPSDILGGAIIGFASLAVVAWIIPREPKVPEFVGKYVRNTPVLYVILFVLMFEVVTMGQDFRMTFKGVFEYVSGDAAE